MACSVLVLLTVLQQWVKSDKFHTWVKNVIYTNLVGYTLYLIQQEIKLEVSLVLGSSVTDSQMNIKHLRALHSANHQNSRMVGSFVSSPVFRAWHMNPFQLKNCCFQTIYYWLQVLTTTFRWGAVGWGTEFSAASATHCFTVQIKWTGNRCLL